MGRQGQRLEWHICKPRIAHQDQELGEKHEPDSTSKPLEGTNPANTLLSDFQPLEL